jgi:DNA polymerase-3 subunit epsilon
VVHELLAYLSGAELIIHNAPFDMGFLNKELARLNQGRMSDCVTGVIDTLVMAKEMFPGKRNSLDALCSRLEVDNSGRTLHGALLDAELLADVYINMTRGQESLVIDSDAGPSDVTDDSGVLDIQDLSHFELPVVFASPSEQHAHEALLADLDKTTKGKTVWRKLEPSVVA